jgi:hypothetical protein
MTKLNVQKRDFYEAQAPASFEELVDGRMAYFDYSAECGGMFHVTWNNVNEAEDEFKATDLWQTLYQAFEQNPEMRELHLTY